MHPLILLWIVARVLGPGHPYSLNSSGGLRDSASRDTKNDANLRAIR